VISSHRRGNISNAGSKCTERRENESLCEVPAKYICMRVCNFFERRASSGLSLLSRLSYNVLRDCVKVKRRYYYVPLIVDSLKRPLDLHSAQSKTIGNRKLQKSCDSKAECDQHSIFSDAFAIALVTPAIVSTTHLV